MDLLREMTLNVGAEGVLTISLVFTWVPIPSQGAYPGMPIQSAYQSRCLLLRGDMNAVINSNFNRASR